jgi:hypothetical protein
MAVSSLGVMKLMRNVIEFDAADFHAESAFWAMNARDGCAYFDTR